MYLIEHSEVLWKRWAVYSCEDEGWRLELHLDQQGLSWAETLGEVFLLYLTYTLSGFLPAEYAQPTELALQVADHSIAVLLWTLFECWHPCLDLKPIALEIAPKFVEKTGLLLAKDEVYDQRRPLLQYQSLHIISDFFLVISLCEWNCKSCVEVMKKGLIFAWRGGRDKRVDCVLFVMIGELCVKAHEWPELVVDWAEERALACASYAESREAYSVWVEGMPV